MYRQNYKKLKDECDVGCNDDVQFLGYINPKTISISQLNSKEWTIEFQLDKDIIRIPNISEKYCKELRDVVGSAQRHNERIRLNWAFFDKQDPQTVHQTFQI